MMIFSKDKDFARLGPAMIALYYASLLEAGKSKHMAYSIIILVGALSCSPKLAPFCREAPPTFCSTPFWSDQIGGSEPILGCLFNSFCLLFICLFVCLFVFFVKVSRPKSPARLEGRIQIEARFTPTICIYLIKTFYLCHFILGFSITRKHVQMVGP